MAANSVRYGAASHVGQVRGRNEDSYLVWVADEEDERQAEAVFLVADGMGGHDAGDVASRFVVSELERAIATDRTFITDQVFSALPKWFSGVSTSLQGLAEERGASRGMGSTATLVSIISGHLVFAHVGDSRLYRLRSGDFEQLSLDHSFAQEQRRRGLLTEEQAAHHPQRNLLTQALGVDRELDVQVEELEWQDGDRYVLCSDGLYGPVNDTRIRTIVGMSDLQEAAEMLVAEANLEGGPDNITAIVFEMIGEGTPSPPLQKVQAVADDQLPTDPGILPVPETASAAHSGSEEADAYPRAASGLDGVHGSPTEEGDDAERQRRLAELAGLDEAQSAGGRPTWLWPTVAVVVITGLALLIWTWVRSQG